MKRVPLQRKTRIRRISTKQRQRTRNLAKQKLAWVLSQFDRYGYAACEGCRRRIYDVDAAMNLLAGHHVKHRSLGGSDEPNNLRYLCNACHQVEHGQ